MEGVPHQSQRLHRALWLIFFRVCTAVPFIGVTWLLGAPWRLFILPGFTILHSGTCSAGRKSFFVLHFSFQNFLSWSLISVDHGKVFSGLLRDGDISSEAIGFLSWASFGRSSEDNTPNRLVYIEIE